MTTNTKSIKWINVIGELVSLFCDYREAHLLHNPLIPVRTRILKQFIADKSATTRYHLILEQIEQVKCMLLDVPSEELVIEYTDGLYAMRAHAMNALCNVQVHLAELARISLIDPAFATGDMVTLSRHTKIAAIFANLEIAFSEIHSDVKTIAEVNSRTKALKTLRFNVGTRMENITSIRIGLLRRALKLFDDVYEPVFSNLSHVTYELRLINIDLGYILHELNKNNRNIVQAYYAFGFNLFSLNELIALHSSIVALVARIDTISDIKDGTESFSVHYTSIKANVEALVYPYFIPR